MTAPNKVPRKRQPAGSKNLSEIAILFENQAGVLLRVSLDAPLIRGRVMFPIPAWAKIVNELFVGASVAPINGNDACAVSQLSEAFVCGMPYA